MAYYRNHVAISMHILYNIDLLFKPLYNYDNNVHWMHLLAFALNQYFHINNAVSYLVALSHLECMCALMCSSAI